MKKSKFCILFVLFVIVADIAAVDAQIVLKGKVTTREEEPVAFAAVSLRGMRDTTRLVETAVTDMQGNYAFGKHREGKYLLTIQSLGFRTLNDTVHIRRSSLGNTYEMRKDYLLEEEATAIDDVVVVGTNVTHYLDRTVYRVTNADRRTAVTGLDLTNKVPREHIRASGRDALATLEYTFAAIQSYENGGELVVPHKLPALHGDTQFVY